ncbi:hypothetical protein [Uliginosibacterium gangwonense]|uniref:hypothetical protein n=1 Tax=Uliginosibacterium gangwonense TaxID=392736 RepID=UPI00036F9A9B|nr:hypothetical protein [Uliginosibacterium gangwonense]
MPKPETQEHLRRYEVSYEVPCTHKVTVGVWAYSAEQVANIAQEEYDRGTIGDNIVLLPLLDDRYITAPGYNVTFRIAPVADFIVQDGARLIQQRVKAFRACEALVMTYRIASAGKCSLSQEDLDEAHRLALAAMPEA